MIAYLFDCSKTWTGISEVISAASRPSLQARSNWSTASAFNGRTTMTSALLLAWLGLFPSTSFRKSTTNVEAWKISLFPNPVGKLINKSLPCANCRARRLGPNKCGDEQNKDGGLAIFVKIKIKSKPELEQYLLCNLDFHAASLKFKARSNTLPINGRTYSWNPDKDSVCPLCKEGTEDLRHFLFICRTLRDIRVTEYHKLEYELVTNNLNQIWHWFISSNLNVKLCLMLGISKEIIPENYSDTCWPTDINYILCIFDSFCKSFLKKAWNLRADFLKWKWNYFPWFDCCMFIQYRFYIVYDLLWL